MGKRSGPADMSILEDAFAIYDAELKKRNDKDYEINKEQFKKLIDIHSFFLDLASKNNGSVEELNLVPKEVSAGITAYFTVLYLYGDDLLKFSKAVKDMGGLSIDTMTDGRVCISFTIPDVFAKKNVNH